MKVLLIGYGKMGKAIEQILIDRGHTIVTAVDSYKEIDKKLARPNEIDVAIEFTGPEAAYENIKYCLDNGIPVLSGTTGWLEQLAEVVELTKLSKGTFFYASNFSLGVNLFFKLNETLARLMKGKGYKTSIEEIHHIHKLDKPSGTAITIAEAIIKESDKLQEWTLEQQESELKLPIAAVRKEEVPGTHTVYYQGDFDKITIQHEALSREGFAIGAVLVSEWLSDKKGVLTMNDFLDV